MRVYSVYSSTSLPMGRVSVPTLKSTPTSSLLLRMLISIVTLLSLMKHCTCHEIMHTSTSTLSETSSENNVNSNINSNHDNIKIPYQVKFDNDIERKLQQPMPMHRHFMMQQQHLAAASVSAPIGNKHEKKNSGNSNNDHDRGNSHSRSNLHRRTRKKNEVLDSTWWFRFDEGTKRPETRRSHHATLYSFDKNTVGVSTSTNGDSDSNSDTNKNGYSNIENGQEERAITETPTATKSTNPPSPSPTVISTLSPAQEVQDNNVEIVVDTADTDTNTDTNTDPVDTIMASSSPSMTSIPNDPASEIEIDTNNANNDAHSNTDVDINTNINNSTSSNSDEDDNNNNRKLRRLKQSSPYQSSTSKTSTTTTRKSQDLQEYMIITGGFTDFDWHTFPIWAFDMTAATDTLQGKWIDLTPLEHKPKENEEEDANLDFSVCSNPDDLTNIHTKDNVSDNSGEDLWARSSMLCAPPSRAGHISLMRDGYLYVFGGLLYNDKDGVFYMEEAPYMYRMNVPTDYFTNPSKYTVADDGDNDGSNQNLKPNPTAVKWERIVPKVNAPPPNIVSNSGSASESSRPEDIINRGEVRGGYWEKGDKLIVYGGLHVRDYETAYGREQQADETLGDVWAYDFKTDTWEMMAPAWAASGNVQSAHNDHLRDHPGQRTSHAADVIGDELIIYGGLRKVETYLWDGSTIWDQLDDVWVFDLNTLKWKERLMKESIGRAYQSVVGWQSEDGEGPVMTSFGGYKTMTDPVDNQQISYVYDDTLVTFPNQHSSNNETGSSIWFLATYEGVQLTISTRLEHTAVLSKAHGNMIVWGGRYRGTSEIDGVWSLNVHGEGSNVLYMVRADDDQVQNVGVAYIVLVTVMMMSMMFTYMCGILHRQIESEEGANISIDQVMDPNNGFSFARRNGLGQDIIDTLPLKKYERESELDNREETKTTPPEDASLSQVEQSTSVSQAGDNGYAEDDDNCCPICLVEYNIGDDIRCLPCKHEFHKSCVDPWLQNNASCPACRHSLLNLASMTTSSSIRNGDNQTEAQDGTEGRIAPVVLFPQFLTRIGRQRQQRQLNSVPSNDSQASLQLAQSSNSGDDSDSMGDLELSLSYSSSLDTDDNLPPSQNRRGRRFRPIGDELPLHGRSRRMRVSAAERRRNRGRMTGRRRGGATSPLNDPLQPANGAIV